MNSKIRGYILKINEYHDNDVIINVLTKEKILGLKVRSAKKINNKNSYSILPFALVEIEASNNNNNNSNHLIVCSLSVLESNRKLREDLTKQCYASMICELVERTWMEFESEDLFDFVTTTFKLLNEKNPIIIYALFLSHLTRKLGVGAYVDGCVECNCQQIVGISTSLGGFVCENCLSSDTVKPDIADLMIFRRINKASYLHYDYFIDHEKQCLSTIKLLEEFLFEFSGIKLKSREVVDALLSN